MSKKITKKKNPIIINNLNDDFIVEKSRPLMLMKEVPFELGELKVLDTYLSRIDARDPKATTVRFSKTEYENLMGIERMHPDRLGKYVDSLMQKIITVPDKRSRKGWKKYTLFSYSECSQDENEQWWIDLTCTQEAKKLFFALDKIGYIRYQLKNILPLNSKYSVLLYIYLLDNRFRSEWDISVDELKTKVFRCTDPLYDEFKYLNQRILKKSLKEVNEKTDLTFEYSLVKTGVRVTAIHWKLIKDEVLLPLEEDPNQMSIDDFSYNDNSLADITDERDRRNEICFGFEDEIFDEFTDDQLKELRSLAWNKVDPEEVEVQNSIFGNLKSAKEFIVASYIRTKILMCNARGKRVKHRYSYIKKAVSENWE